jgi:hypothetical protein
MEIPRIRRLDFVAQQRADDGNPGVFEPSDARPGYTVVGVDLSDIHRFDSRGDDSLGTGRGPTIVIAGLEADEHCGTAKFAFAKRDNLSVGLANTLMRAGRKDIALWRGDDSSDTRIRVRLR